MFLPRRFQPPGLCSCVFRRECQSPDTRLTCVLISSKTLFSLSRPFLTVMKPFRSAATPPHLSLSHPLCYIFLRSIRGFLTYFTFHFFVCLYQGKHCCVHCVSQAPRTVPGTWRCSGNIRCVIEVWPPSAGSLGEQRVCFLFYPPPFPTPPAGQPLQAQPPEQPAGKWLSGHK